MRENGSAILKVKGVVLLPCKIMVAVIPDLSPSFKVDGFNNWNHATKLLRKNEQNEKHRQALVSFVDGKNVDAQIQS